MLLAQELAFTKFTSFVKLQKESGTRVADDKLNSTTAEEIITSTVIGYCNACIPVKKRAVLIRNSNIVNGRRVFLSL